MGAFGNHLVLDTSNTVVNDATVTRINYTALWREQDTKQQLTVVKRFVAEPAHKATANRPLQHLANNIHSLRHLAFGEHSITAATVTASRPSVPFVKRYWFLAKEAFEEMEKHVQWLRLYA